MEKWVEEILSSEELLDEVLEKVNLVIRNREKGLEKGSALVQKKVGKPRDLEISKTLMRGWGENRTEESVGV